MFRKGNKKQIMPCHITPQEIKKSVFKWKTSSYYKNKVRSYFVCTIRIVF